jgi:hypothetical protein
MTASAPARPDIWGRATLDGLERKNLWVVALASVTAWAAVSGEWAVNVLAAGLLGALNLRALRRSVERLLGGPGRPSRWFVVVSTIRFILFLNLLGIVLLLFPVTVPAFAAGLSTIVVAAVAETIEQVFRRTVA